MLTNNYRLLLAGLCTGAFSAVSQAQTTFIDRDYAGGYDIGQKCRKP